MSDKAKQDYEMLQYCNHQFQAIMMQLIPEFEKMLKVHYDSQLMETVRNKFLHNMSADLLQLFPQTHKDRALYYRLNMNDEDIRKYGMWVDLFKSSIGELSLDNKMQVVNFWMQPNMTTFDKDGNVIPYCRMATMWRSMVQDLLPCENVYVATVRRKHVLLQTTTPPTVAKRPRSPDVVAAADLPNTQKSEDIFSSTDDDGDEESVELVVEEKVECKKV